MSDKNQIPFILSEAALKTRGRIGIDVACDSERAKHEREYCKVKLKVGIHSGCKGEIQYTSEFRMACSAGEMRIGGSNPVREDVKCTCIKCGVMFNPYFSVYRDQVTAWRERTD